MTRLLELRWMGQGGDAVVQAPQLIAIPRGGMIVGRGVRNDLTIADTTLDREHVAFAYAGPTALEVRRLGRGTLKVAGREVGETAERASVGDGIQLGRTLWEVARMEVLPYEQVLDPAQVVQAPLLQVVELDGVWRMTLAGVQVALSPAEGAVLQILARSPQLPFTPQSLAEHVEVRRGSGISVIVQRLRDKCSGALRRVTVSHQEAVLAASETRRGARGWGEIVIASDHRGYRLALDPRWVGPPRAGGARVTP